MNDDQSNPLGQKIHNLEELVKDTEKQVDTTLQELQTAEENGTLEEYLEARKKKSE